jgi:hypothetical protein
MRVNSIFVSGVLWAAVLLVASPGLPQQVPPQITPKIQVGEAATFPAVPPGPINERATVTKLASNVNALIDKISELPIYIVWGCASPDPKNPYNFSHQWVRPDLQPPSVAPTKPPKPKITFTNVGGTATINLTWENGDWRHSIFLVPATGGKAAPTTLSFPQTTQVDAQCTPYFIAVEPWSP